MIRWCFWIKNILSYLINAHLMIRMMLFAVIWMDSMGHVCRYDETALKRFVEGIR